MHETSDLENYGKGHRTFDCPWCGAISGIDPSHIGEHFDCPECHKSTKLTPANTRDRHVTDASKDAPPHEESKSKLAPLLLVLAIAAVIGVVVFLTSTGGGDDEGTGGEGTDVARTTPPDEGLGGESPAAGAPPEEASPGEAPPEEVPSTDEPQPPEPQPPEEMPPEEVPPPEDAAAGLVEAAKLDLEQARQALADWEAAHPELMEKFGLLRACTDVRSEAARLCEAYPGPDATQAEARVYNEVMRAFVAADPKRMEAAQRIVEELNSERLKPLFLESWEGVNFYLPHVRITMGRMEAAGECVESEEYGALVRRIHEAQAAVEKAAAGG